MFIAMKNFFEGYFERVKDKVEIITATEGGLNIDYTRKDTFEDVISVCNFKTYDIQDKIQKIYQENKFSKEIGDRLNKYNNSILIEITRLEELNKKQLKLVDLIKRDFYHSSKNKKAFDKIVMHVAEFNDIIMESFIYKSILKIFLLWISYFLRLNWKEQRGSYKDTKK
jgi:hypothetical protein